MDMDGRMLSISVTLIFSQVQYESNLDLANILSESLEVFGDSQTDTHIFILGC